MPADLKLQAYDAQTTLHEAIRTGTFHTVERLLPH